ncbi:MAG: 3'(2'),5'-bisphosphate nucleotidase CysQ [Rikenellaceae bacterium]
MMQRELEIAIKAALSAAGRIMKVYNDPLSDFMIERKSDNSPLTIADKLSHAIIVEALEPLLIPILSEEGASTAYAIRKNWNQLWIVDPIDGTKEFIKRNGEFTVNIAKVVDGYPVLGVIYVPANGDLYYGSKDEGAFKASGVHDFNMVERLSVRIPIAPANRSYRIVASRSHLSDETAVYIEKIKKEKGDVEIVSKGSSLKICLVAEGVADIYPRFAPTMEWDTAAGDAILRAAGKLLVDKESGKPLTYNKENLLNPHFIAR